MKNEFICHQTRVFPSCLWRMDLPYRLPSQCPLRSPFSRQPRARHRVPYTRAGRLRNPQARCVDCHGRKGRKINGQDQRLPLSESQRRDGPWAQMTKTETQEVGPRDCPVAGGFNMQTRQHGGSCEDASKCKGGAGLALWRAREGVQDWPD